MRGEPAAVQDGFDGDAVFAVPATFAGPGASHRLTFVEAVRLASGGGAKRLVDIILSALLLLVLAPLGVLVAIAIKLDSPGPVLYRCRRVGFCGDPLDMLKFRKMADGARGPGLTTADDARLTRFGRFLAATKLDELPQLWHVLRGQMSLVGPRPEDPSFAAVHLAEYRQIIKVKPGITGLSQLAFACEMKILDADDRIGSYLDRLLPAKVQLDLLYARNRTFLMDLSILAWTVVAVVLRREVAVNRSSGRVGLRRRPRLNSSAPETESAISC